MSSRKRSAKDIVATLRLVRALTEQGKPVADALREANVVAVTYYRWRKRYEGLGDRQVEWLAALQAENVRLRRTAAKLELDKSILRSIAQESLSTPSLRRQRVERVMAELNISERQACEALGQHRSTQRKLPKLMRRSHDGAPYGHLAAAE